MGYLKAKMKDADFMCKIFYIMTGLLILNRFFTFIMMIFFANYGGINVEGYAKSSNILLSLLSANNFNPVKNVHMWSSLEYSLAFLIPLAGYAYFCSSTYGKNRVGRRKIFVFTILAVSLLGSFMLAEWSNNLICYLLSLVGSQNLAIAWSEAGDKMMAAIRAGTIYIPTLAIAVSCSFTADAMGRPDTTEVIRDMKIIDNTPKAMATGKYTCEVAVCKDASSGQMVVVPENRRMESTLIQGATGTGKTSTLLLPMCASDLEKKFFFREEGKRLAIEALSKGIAYIESPYSNEELNRNFSLGLIKPKEGKEEEFEQFFGDMIKNQNHSTGEYIYKDLGITVVEPDGNYCDNFKKVAKNYGIEVKTIDPQDPDSYGMNPFQNKDPDKAASIISNVLQGMYESENPGGNNVFFGQVTQQALENLALLLKVMYPRTHNGEMPTLEDMLKMMYDYNLVEAMCEELKKDAELAEEYRILVKYFEKNFYNPPYDLNGRPIPGTVGSGRKETEKFLYGATTQLDNLMRHEMVKKILCSRDRNLDFDKVLSEGQCVSVCTRRGELGGLLSKPFGMFFILSMQDAVLRRPGNESTRIPHFLYIDEFPDFVNKETETCFTLFRKYRCAMIVAIQNLSQLARTESMKYYKQVVVSNTKTQLVFGDTNVEDSEYWSAVFGKRECMDYKYSLSMTPLSQVKDGTGLSDESVGVGIKYTDNIKPHAVNQLAFKTLYYVTRDAKGNKKKGTGKTDFLNARHKKMHEGKTYDFTKYPVHYKLANGKTYWNDSISIQEDEEHRVLNGATSSMPTEI